MASESDMIDVRNGRREPDDARKDWGDLYQALRSRLQDEGCFDPAPRAIVINMTGTLALLSVSYLLLLTEPSWFPRILLLVLAAFASVHAGFVGHYAGHGAITPNRGRATAIGRLYFTFLTGVTFAHFQNIHRQHHPNCNCRIRDPDLQTGVFACRFTYRQRERSN